MSDLETDHEREDDPIPARRCGHEALIAAARVFCAYYAGEKALRLGNGQARKSLDSIRKALATIDAERR